MTDPAKKSAQQHALTYAGRLRMAMKTHNNPSGRSLSAKELAAMVGYSYESVRRLVAGLPAAGRTLNDLVCSALGLPEEQMWELAKIEKVTTKFGHAFLAELPHDKRLVSIFPLLTPPNRERLIQVAEGLLSSQGIDARVLDAPPSALTAPMAEKLDSLVTKPLPSRTSSSGKLPATQAPAPSVVTTRAATKKAAKTVNLSSGDVESPWMSLAQVQAYLGVSTPQSAYKWLRNHHMPRSAGQIRVHRTNLDRVIAGLPPKPLASLIKRP